jgi:hypothetical protein
VQASNPLRFRSQVFSTSQRFPGKPEFHGPVSCRNRPWDSSFRAFPSQESRAPLEAASSPAVIHARAACAQRGLSRLVSADARDRSRLPGLPEPLWGSFQPTEADLPSPLAPTERNHAFRPLHLLRSLVPPESPFTTAWVSPPRRPMLSWTFALLKSSPPVPRSLNPSRPRAELLTPPVESALRRKGPLDPSRQVGPRPV